MWKIWRNRERCMMRTKITWKRKRKINRERCTRRTKMTWKRERNRMKCMMRTKILWKRERKTDMKVNRVGRKNMKQKPTGTTSPQPS